MQEIRKSQRKRGDLVNKNSKQPEDVKIGLKSITLVFCYEYEQFSSIHKSLKKYFKNNKDLLKRIDNIRNSENTLDDAGWYNLGTIASNNNTIIFRSTTKQSKLPNHVEHIDISHHKLLPSLASLEFTIRIGEAFQKELTEIADRYYLPTAVSESLWPGKLFSTCTMSFTTRAKKEVRQRLNEFTNKVTNWLINDLQLNKKHIHFSAALPLYQLEYPSKEINFSEYAESHKSWLSKYGYKDAYFSDSTIFCPVELQSASPLIAPLFYRNPEQDISEYVLKEFLRGMVCSTTLLARLTDYKTSIETLRSKSLKNLNIRWRIIRKSGSTIYDLKHLILRIKRMLAEFKQSKRWFEYELRETVGLKTLPEDKQSDYASNVLKFFESELESLVNSAIMVDEALSDRLATENIYVMYRLQKRMFWLTIVGLFIAAIGLIAIWDKIILFNQHLWTVIRNTF